MTSARTSTCVSGRGWHRGMSSAVRFAAMMPATRAVSSGSPFGVRRSRTASTVPGDISTRALATARRAVASFALVSTIATRPRSSMCDSSLIVFEVKIYLTAKDAKKAQRTQSSEPIDHPLNTVLHPGDFKIEQEAELTTRQLQVRQDLCEVYVVQCFHRFHFYYQAVLYHQVNPVTALKLNFFVNQRHRLLLLYAQAGLAQLIKQTLLICRFKQPRPERLVDDYRAADHNIRQFILPHPLRPSRLLCTSAVRLL